MIPLAVRAAEEFEVPVALVMAVIRTESDFRADAVSVAGARGYMQLMPETFDWLREEKLCEPYRDDQIEDPTVNVRFGTYYLAYLLEQFGTWREALAAYNAGEGRVREWLEDPALSRDGTLLEIPFSETETYVEQVLDAYEHYTKKYSKYKEHQNDRQ